MTALTVPAVPIEGAELLVPFLNETVLVSVCRFISGNSSIPHSEQVDEVIGELSVSKIDASHFTITDGFLMVAEIKAVYQIGEGFNLRGSERIHIKGWLSGYGQSMSLWGQWVVSK